MSLRVFALAFLFAGTVCSATPLPILGTDGTSDVAYNATTQTFTENAHFPGGLTTTLYGLTRNYQDFSGTYNTTATVDSAGVTHGGSVTLFGSSVSMGILTPQLFFSGTVLSTRYGEDALGTIFFDTVARISVQAPEMVAAMGAMDLIHTHTNGAMPAASFFANPIARTGPWAGSFDASGNHFDSSPNIARLVPEPATLELMAAGLLLLTLLRLRPRA
jgi:hypothetical protein